MKKESKFQYQIYVNYMNIYQRDTWNCPQELPIACDQWVGNPCIIPYYENA